MSQRYLMNCPDCDTENKIETRHAGSTIKCIRCKAAIQVGTLREIRKLAPEHEPDELEEPKLEKVAWNPLKRWFFVIGIVLLASCSVLAALAYQKAASLYQEKPSSTVDPRTHRIIDDLTPVEMAKSWQSVSESDIAEWVEGDYLKARQASTETRIIAYIWTGLALLGLASLVSAVLIKNRTEF